MAMTGLGVGLAVALLVMLVATRNAIISLTAIVTIACALSCVIGTIQLKGWQFGMSEALSVMVLAGFSVR